MQHTPAICPSTKPQLHQPQVFCSIWLALLDELYGSGSPPAVFVDPLPDADQRSSFSYGRTAITLLPLQYNVRLSPCCSRSCNAAQRSRGRDPQGLLTRATQSCRCFSTNLRINECRVGQIRNGLWLRARTRLCCWYLITIQLAVLRCFLKAYTAHSGFAK
nr:hypothetical protein CFP56_02705 [Quercus suber]